MPNINYVAQGLDGEQIEAALNAIHGVVVPENNGKVLAIENGVIVAKSATEWVDLNLQSKTITPEASQQVVVPDSGYNGLDSVTVNGDVDLIAENIKKDVEIFGITGSYEGGGSTLITKNIIQNGTYNANSDGADGYSVVIVNVSSSSDVIFSKVTSIFDIPNSMSWESTVSVTQ